MMLRHRRTLIAMLLASAVGVARAEPTPEQLKELYEDSQRQLQQSQDRKNQLANENEQLRTRVAELEGRLQAIERKAQQAEFLRNQFAVWAGFMEQYPNLLKRFETYVTGDSGVPRPLPTPSIFLFHDPQWPFSAAGRLGDGL